MGRDHGLKEEQLRDLPVHETSAAYTPLEKRVLDYAAALTRTPTEVPDELFEELRKDFDEPQLVELTGAIAWENYRARFNCAFRIESQGFSEGAYCPLPERPRS